MPYNKETSECVKIVFRKEELAILKKEAETMSLSLATYIKVIIANRIK